MNNMDYSRLNIGKCTGLNPITTINNNITNTTDQKVDDNNNEVEDDSATNNTTYCTKIIRVTPETFERLRTYSNRLHPQPISYDEIFLELLDFYYNNNK